jgi:hypothetical protein
MVATSSSITPISIAIPEIVMEFEEWQRLYNGVFSGHRRVIVLSVIDTIVRIVVFPVNFMDLCGLTLYPHSGG